jgi:hypothetical protein
VRRASARATLPLAPSDVLRLWTDVERWPSFVEGFARRLELTDAWPEPGGRIVWESAPSGRGRVTETVVEQGADRFSTQVFEEALAGVQTLRVVPADDSGGLALSSDGPEGEGSDYGAEGEASEGGDEGEASDVGAEGGVSDVGAEAGASEVGAEAGASEVELSLEYELARYGPLRGLADALFIRRALRDALRRTLYRFAIEAEEEANLR